MCYNQNNVKTVVEKSICLYYPYFYIYICDIDFFGDLHIFKKKVWCCQKISCNSFCYFLSYGRMTGIVYYKRYHTCKECGDKATYKTPFGYYCKDCFEESHSKTCAQCGDEFINGCYIKGKNYCTDCGFSKKLQNDYENRKY